MIATRTQHRSRTALLALFGLAVLPACASVGPLEATPNLTGARVFEGFVAASTQGGEAGGLVIFTLHGSNTGYGAPMHRATVNSIVALAESGSVDLAASDVRHLGIEYDYRDPVATAAHNVAAALAESPLRPEDRVLVVGHSQGAYVGYWLLRNERALFEHNPTVFVAVDPDKDSMDLWSRLAVVGSYATRVIPGLDRLTYAAAGASIANSRSDLFARVGFDDPNLPMILVDTAIHTPYRRSPDYSEADRSVDLARVDAALADALGALGLVGRSPQLASAAPTAPVLSR